MIFLLCGGGLSSAGAQWQGEDRKVKSKFTNVLLVLIFVAGLSLLLYPTVSDYWNSLHQSRVIIEYSEGVSSMNEDRYKAIKEEADEYNLALAGSGDGAILEKEYNDLLDPLGTGVMGYLEIPVIGCELPIAHGTDDSTLKDSVGHIEWSSLPVGGKGTHSVLSGHRGLPTAELLTNIDKLEAGDIFILHILGEELKYRVDQILIVEPEDTSALKIINDKDLVTLVTCTPYGINSHRLLVRGVRAGDDAGVTDRVKVTNEAKEISAGLLTACCILVIVTVAFVMLALRNTERSRLKKERKEKRLKRKLHYQQMQRDKSSSRGDRK